MANNKNRSLKTNLTALELSGKRGLSESEVWYGGRVYRPSVFQRALGARRGGGGVDGSLNLKDNSWMHSPARPLPRSIDGANETDDCTAVAMTRLNTLGTSEEEEEEEEVMMVAARRWR